MLFLNCIGSDKPFASTLSGVIKPKGSGVWTKPCSIVV